MSIKTGSNFSYAGPRFLDARQGIPKKLEDLKTWDVLVPKGFEVFVSRQWFVYDPERPEDPKTGKFHPRLAQGLGDDEFSGVSQKVFTDSVTSLSESLQELYNNTWPIVFGDLKGGGWFEKGRSVLPSVSWSLYRENEPEKTIIPDEVTVNGSTDGISYNKNSWTGTENITSDTCITIQVNADNMIQSKEVWFKFGFPRFYGVSNLPSLNSNQIRSLGRTDWEETTALGPMIFDCQGGKYPWLCFSSSLFNPDTFECWVGGLRSTDLVVEEVEVTNSYGYKEKYTCVRLGMKQTGRLMIEFKNNE